MDIADCEGGDGRCTANGRTIRRGGAADGNPGARPRADAVTAAIISTAGTAFADGTTTPRTPPPPCIWRTGARGTRARRGAGASGEFPRDAVGAPAGLRWRREPGHAARIR